MLNIDILSNGFRKKTFLKNTSLTTILVVSSLG